MIFKYSGDTKPLSDELQEALDAIIWNEIMNKEMNKVKSSNDFKIPDIICFEPSGPNYTRVDMKVTHQSTSYSVLLKFIESQNLAKFSKKGSEEFLTKIFSILIHHNKFELGSDRFNEGLFIFKKLLNYILLKEDELQAEMVKQETKLINCADKNKLKESCPLFLRFVFLFVPKQSSILIRSKEFIIKDLMLVEKKLECTGINNVRHYISKYLLSNTFFPKIGEKFNEITLNKFEFNLKSIKKY